MKYPLTNLSGDILVRFLVIIRKMVMRRKLKLGSIYGVNDLVVCFALVTMLFQEIDHGLM